MRRKITTTAQLEAAGADLPELTPQQQKFVEGLLGGLTASDAYRAAYDCSNSQNNTIWARASALNADSRVQVWLSAARQAHLGSGKVTLDNHIRELERLKEIAIKTGNVGAAVQAEQLRGKAQGHYVEKLEVHATDPLDTLRQIAALSPELAAQLARQQGIEWTAETSH